MSQPRRFTPPWSAELQPNHYVVPDANKQQIATSIMSASRGGDRRQQRRGSADCHQYCQARSARCWPTCTLAHTYKLWRTGGRAVGNMSEEPRINMAWYLLGRAAPKNAECVAL